MKRVLLVMAWVSLVSLASPAHALDWTIRTVDNAGGAYSSIAVDSSGRPHISYAAGLELRHAG